MAATIEPYIFLPSMGGLSVGAYTATTTITVTGDKLGCVFQAPATGSLTDVYFELSTVTTGTTADVRLETVTTGDPSGSLQAANTNVAVVLTAGTDSNVIKTGTLTAAATVTKGDLLALVVVNGASAGNFALRADICAPTLGFPYRVRFAAAAWVEATNGIGGGVKIGGTLYGFGPFSHAKTGTATATTNFNSGSATDEQGNQFVADFPYQITGFYGNFTAAGAANTWDAVLYEGTTAILTKTVTPDARQASGTWQQHFFATSYILVPGLTYRIVMKPTSANNVALDNMVYSSGLLRMSPGLGAWTYVSRVDAGAFSTTADKLAQIGLIADGINPVPIGGMAGISQGVTRAGVV